MWNKFSSKWKLSPFPFSAKKNLRSRISFIFCFLIWAAWLSFSLEDSPEVRLRCKDQRWLTHVTGVDVRTVLKTVSPKKVKFWTCWRIGWTCPNLPEKQIEPLRRKAIWLDREKKEHLGRPLNVAPPPPWCGASTTPIKMATCSDVTTSWPQL